MTTPGRNNIRWLRNTAPYINAHRGKTFVLMLGGEVAQHENFASIFHDIALLSSLGVRLVLVHGSRPQIAQRLEQAGLESVFHDGMRITDTAVLEHVKDAAGSLRTQIEALLSMGLPNSPMQGSRLRVCSGNFVTARPIGVVNGVECLIGGTDSLSMHGLARAIDLKWFRTSDGHVYDVEDHWEHDTENFRTEEGRFLFELGQQMFARRIFNIVLTPNYNAAHDNHFHVDLTPGQRFIGSEDAWTRYFGPNPHGD